MANAQKLEPNAMPGLRFPDTAEEHIKVTTSLRENDLIPGAQMPVELGEFHFRVALTNNSTTRSSLTTAAAIRSPLIRYIAAGQPETQIPNAAPMIMMAVSAVRARWHNPEALTSSLLEETADSLYVNHESGVLRRRTVIEMGEYVETSNNVLIGQPAANATNRSQGRAWKWYRLPNPLLVDLNQDVLQFGCADAINWGGNQTFSIMFEGAVWASSLGRPLPRDCASMDPFRAYLRRSAQYGQSTPRDGYVGKIVARGRAMLARQCKDCAKDGG